MSTVEGKDKEKPTKEKLSTWVAIGISFLVGLSSLVTSLYSIQAQKDIAAQQNSTQKQIVQLQYEIQKNNSFAHLELRSISYSTFAISNSGPDTAKNVKLVVAILGINAMWKKSLTDINDFIIEISNPSLISSSEKTSVFLQEDTGIVGKNAYMIDINSLPPQEIIEFTVSLDPKISIRSYDFTSKISIYLKALKKPFTLNDMSSLTLPILDQYLIQKFGLAGFEAVSSCDNCNETYNPAALYGQIPDKYSNATDDLRTASNLAGLPIIISPFEGYREIDWGNYQGNNKFFLSSVNATASFKVPASSPPISLPSTFNLQAFLIKTNESISGPTTTLLYFDISECLPSNCMNFDKKIIIGG